MRSGEQLNLGLLGRPGWTGWGVTLAAVFLPVVALAGSDDWSQFRGPDGNGICIQGQVPVEWSNQRNLAWKVRIPGAGWSQPVIFGNSVFLTTAVSDHPSRPKNYENGTIDPHTVSGDKAPAPEVMMEWKVLAIDLQSGAQKWISTVVSGKPRYPIHPSNTYASETPAVDARGIYVWFGASGTAAALDHAGRLLWRREMGVFRQQQNLGGGSSLRLCQGLLYLQCFNEEQAFLICLDTREGREKWRISRDRPGTAWTTPLLWQNAGRLELIACGQKLITSHDPLTGRELWRGSGIEMPGPASLTADRNRLYFGFKSSGKKTKLYALNAGAEGDQSVAEGSKTFRCEAWALLGAAPGMASPVVTDDCVYVVNDGVVGCYDTASGREHFKARLPGFHCVVASPLVVGRQVIFLDESGSAAVLKAGSQFEILGRSKLDDTFWASPATAHDALVLRGVDYVYCIRE
jgi:outer membrane protein assembly factor BamB